MWKCAKCGKVERYHFGKGRETGFPMLPKAMALVVPRTSHVAGVRVVYVSNVIYCTISFNSAVTRHADFF